MSSMWCGTPRRCAGLSLAVPISMPVYSCIESALITSPPSARARPSDSSDFPAAVGPTTAITRSSTRHALVRPLFLPGGDQVGDAVGPGHAAQGAAHPRAGGRAGEHLPGGTARDHQLAVEHGVQPAEPAGVRGGERLGYLVVVLLRHGVGGALDVAGPAR